jgi:GT2 family glycosyltransferase
MKVAIVVVSHNAPRYCWKLLRSLRRTRCAEYALVWVDNRSRLPTRLLLMAAAAVKRITRLVLMDRNLLFAEANNVGVAAAPRDCDLVLLLNSDTEVNDPNWLARLIDLHRGGATALGAVIGEPVTRAEGYCLLVDRAAYLEVGGLDEAYQWWWSVTLLQAELLRRGRQVRAVPEHDELLVHHGGKSGDDWQDAAGMDVTPEQVRGWFAGGEVEVIP